MKVGIERKRGPREVDELEVIRTASRCINCRQERTVVHLLPHRKTSMRLCTNPNCCMYSNLDNLTSWKQ